MEKERTKKEKRKKKEKKKVLGRKEGDVVKLVVFTTSKCCKIGVWGEPVSSGCFFFLWDIYLCLLSSFSLTSFILLHYR